MHDHSPFPALFGTTPTSKQCRVGNGDEESGPKILPAAHSFASSASITCGYL